MLGVGIVIVEVTFYDPVVGDGTAAGSSGGLDCWLGGDGALAGSCVLDRLQSVLIEGVLDGFSEAT